jgi:hypothetical protein
MTDLAPCPFCATEVKIIGPSGHRMSDSGGVLPLIIATRLTWLDPRWLIPNIGGIFPCADVGPRARWSSEQSAIF